MVSESNTVVEQVVERLYRLLPSIYRQRDLTEGEPLRALLAVIEGELTRIETDIDELYDNWFIETCEEWAVPYIGDLLDIGGLQEVQQTGYSQRACVANTVGYRRRKGTPATLEQVAQDITGWRVRVVEFLNLLSLNQNVQQIRLERGRSVDLRDKAALALIDDPFDSLARRVDVRRIASKRGRHNLPNVGLMVWRLQSYPVIEGMAAALADAPDGRYTIHPLGVDAPLFNRPQSQTASEMIDLPVPIEAAALTADLTAYREQYRDIPPDRRPADSAYYGPNRSVNIVGVSPMDVMSADLSEWVRPPGKEVAVDVRLGRLMIAPEDGLGLTPSVSYSYGFSADIGGGPYNRDQTQSNRGQEVWQALVSRSAIPDQDPKRPTFSSLNEALAEWIRQGSRGVIQIADNGDYDADLDLIDLTNGALLVIESGNGMRPSVRPRRGLRVTGQVKGHVNSLMLDGLLLSGGIDIQGSLELGISHCTVPAGIRATGDAHELRVTISRSIVGPLRLPYDIAGLEIQDSIIDGGKTDAVAIAADERADAPGPPTTIERTTVLGRVFVGEFIIASEAIFVGRVTVQRRQSGGMRFCYVPASSETPRRFRCQPDLALADVLDLVERERLLRRLTPSFVSTRYGDPGFAQLSANCAEEIRGGAEDGSEMGAFHLLGQPHRVANLGASLEEYLPAGLEIGILYAT